MNTQPTMEDCVALLLLLTKEERLALYEAIREKARGLGLDAALWDEAISRAKERV